MGFAVAVAVLGWFSLSSGRQIGLQRALLCDVVQRFISLNEMFAFSIGSANFKLLLGTNQSKTKSSE